MTKTSRTVLFFAWLAISTALSAQTTAGAPVLLRSSQTGTGAAARRASLVQQRDVQLRKIDNAEQLRREAASMRRGTAAPTPAERSQRAVYEASRQREVERYWGVPSPAPAAAPTPAK